MDRREILEKLRAFPYDRGEYWVITGGAMALYGIRDKTHDIDLGCTSAMADRLEAEGCVPALTSDGKRKFRYGEDIEIFEGWLRGTVETVEGFPVISIGGLIEMKKELGREKDKRDLELISEFLKKKDARSAEEPGRDRLVEWAKELQSIAQAGLFYGRDDFDRERYLRVREISAEMLSRRSGLPVDTVRELFFEGSGYQTPKLDTRAAIIENGKILLVRERSGKWSMPGGWCDHDLSPAQNTVKEAKEEAGLDVSVERLIAVQDRERHNRPPYVFRIVKIFFLCRAVGGDFVRNIETSASGYFPEDGLPPLAEEKCTEEQVKMCFEAYRDSGWKARFE